LTEIFKTSVVPYSANEMYALVNDIESYPDFLPWCSASHILHQDKYKLTASVSIKAGKIKYTFTTENIMQPGQHIKMRLVKGPFKRLKGKWLFVPVHEKSCTITLDMDFEFKNNLIKLTLSGVFNRIMNSLVDSFTKRAIEIYGKR
jgi:ribosome-associated toxin RatA of RatAB toxin-antitoxin module